MATPLTDKINNLITYANGVTSKTDTTLSDAVKSLADGYGQGGTTPTLVQKSITLNGTYDPDDDNADGYSEVTVNVQNGASMTEAQNQYGTELIISSAEGSAPSATRHTIYFEFEDETSTTIYAYYDSTFIGNAITATAPTTYDGKTVTSAQLDGVEWYSYTPTPVPPEPSGNWETVFDGTVTSVRNDNGRNVFRSTEMEDIWFALGETWRVTLNGVAYVCDVEYLNGSTPIIGNESLVDEDNGTDEPFIMYNIGSGYMIGVTREEGTLSLKLEEKVE